MHYTRRTMVFLAGLCLLPLVALIVAAALAGLMGCELNEGVTQPCVIAGFDLGGFLSGLFVSGWLALITLPLLMCLLALWAFVEGGSHWRKRRKERKAEYKDAIES
jgi:hypothetical protein